MKTRNKLMHYLLTFVAFGHVQIIVVVAIKKAVWDYAKTAFITNDCQGVDCGNPGEYGITLPNGNHSRATLQFVSEQLVAIDPIVTAAINAAHSVFVDSIYEFVELSAVTRYDGNDEEVEIDDDGRIKFTYDLQTTEPIETLEEFCIRENIPVGQYDDKQLTDEKYEAIDEIVMAEFCKRN